MNTPTPTPRTDEIERTADLGKDQDWLLDHARTLERELADMTARAEAAEAALTEKHEALKTWQNIREWLEMDPYIYGYLSAERERISKCEDAIKITTSETRSVIAGLREEVKSERDGRYEERYQREKVEAQRDALISTSKQSLAEITLNGTATIKTMKRYDAAVSGAQAGANIDAEVSEMRRDLDAQIKRDCGLTATIPAKELSELREDKARLDWLDRNCIHLYDGGGAFCLDYGSLRKPKSVGNCCTLGTPRAAIDAARKASA
jgi:hypothetical protein